MLGWAVAWLLAAPQPASAEDSAVSLSQATTAQEVALGTLAPADPPPTAVEDVLFGASDSHIYILREGEYPDSLQAAEAEIDSQGLVQAWGGVTLTITSLVDGRTVLATAESASYDQETGVAQLAGAVNLSLSGTPLAVDCDELAYDPGMQRLDVAGLRLGLPFAEMLDSDNLAAAEPRAELPGHFLGLPPETLWLLAGQAHFEQRADSQSLVLSGARFTHSSHPEPDLFVSANEVLFNGSQVILRGLALEISGIRLGSWPQYTLPTEQEPHLYSFGLPKANVSGDGVAWRQPVYFDFGSFKTDLLLDYSADFDLLAHAYTYVTPLNGMELGVEYGGLAQVDTRRVPYERHAGYNLLFRQRLNLAEWGIRQFELAGEYGDLNYKTPGSVRENVPAGQVEDTRLAGESQLEFALVPLGGGLYFTSGLGGKYIEYQDANEDYRVFSGQAGLILRQGRFDNFVLYRNNDDQGTPVFATDAVRRQEVDFAASARLFPQLRHVIQGVYDIDREAFHTLQVSTLKRLNSYEVGAYWDFVRDTAGLEIGLILD